MQCGGWVNASSVGQASQDHEQAGILQAWAEMYCPQVTVGREDGGSGELGEELQTQWLFDVSELKEGLSPLWKCFAD